MPPRHGWASTARMSGLKRIGLIHPGFSRSLLGVRKSKVEPVSMKSWEDQTIGLVL